MQRYELLRGDNELHFDFHSHSPMEKCFAGKNEFTLVLEFLFNHIIGGDFCLPHYEMISYQMNSLLKRREIFRVYQRFFSNEILTDEKRQQMCWMQLYEGTDLPQFSELQHHVRNLDVSGVADCFIEPSIKKFIAGEHQ